ncbi:hypothetical protein KQX54_014431 [Cotesia glomerata]|uniref:Nuclease HARBI1 n=1 Tax=Cotesia glomerata TaxID=32391 RepID=A0AAV7IZ55_COTGL|nr:hypothetical protein KQX54_014431 [Cotesia glomerata]
MQKATSSVNRFQRRIKRSTINSSICNSNIKESKVSKARQLLKNLNFQDENSTPVNQTTCDAETGVNFLSDDDDDTRNFYKSNTIFICINHRSSNVCDAETQIYIPRKNKINPSPNISDTFKPSEACKTGFHGYSSVKDTVDEVRDLCGVSLETFKLLLNMLLRTKFDNRQKVSMEDRLFIFLVKMRTGLTFTALGALFRLHRTTISTIFTDTLVYLAGSCRNFVSWPSKETIRAMMPDVFKDSYKNCPEQVEETYQVASVRIHIERVMQRIRTYKIVDKFTIDLLPYSDAIVFMCCVLVNLQPPIIKVNETKESKDNLISTIITKNL